MKLKDLKTWILFAAIFCLLPSPVSAGQAVKFLDQTGTSYGIKRLGTSGATENIPLFGMSDSDGNSVSTQYPLQVDGDSIYSKDIDSANSDIGTFTGDILTLFNDYGTEITDTTATNPKTYTIHFDRPIKSNTVAFGSQTGDFSNVKIQLKDLAGTVRTIIDDSASDTKHTSNVYSFTTNVFIEAVIEFHTDDAVKISGMYIPKVQSRAISAIDGHVSETNTTEEVLGIDGVFTGGQVDTLNYGMVMLAVYSDVASATDGLEIQFRSTPAGTWRASDNFTIPAATDKTYSIQAVRRFMRIVYTNGGTGQATFDLQTVLKPVYVKPSSHRVGDAISAEDDAELVKAALTGQKPNLDWVNFQATAAGNFKVSVEEYDPISDPVRIDMEGGGKVAVGTTAVEVTFTGTTKKILIKADGANSGDLYIGESNVTTAGANALIFLDAGEEITLDYDDSSNPVYVVGSAASQNFWKGAIL
ncbi:MAG: hypothetical protein KAS32_20260 [Candidatus Peribacteraceae bacterium]|nr:hypothetical protein [Candidatus Peribacteraceae bacterium]